MHFFWYYVVSMAWTARFPWQPVCAWSFRWFYSIKEATALPVMYCCLSERHIILLKTVPVTGG